MALRLRRDVQKASYYVWFLGAEEAKGLRGARVINSVLPYLVDRSRGQEPLKVTLQVSHKGIKIVQVSELSWAKTRPTSLPSFPTITDRSSLFLPRFRVRRSI